MSSIGVVNSVSGPGSAEKSYPLATYLFFEPIELFGFNIISTLMRLFNVKD